MVDNSVLHKEVSKLLTGADLNDLTVKKVRKQLEQRLGVSLADRKTDIEQAIESVLSARGASSSQDEAKSNSSNKSNDEDDTDSSLSELEDAGVVPSKKSAKPSSSSASSAKKPKQQKDLTDEELARQLHQTENGLTTRRRRTVASSGGGADAKSKKAPRKSGGGFSKPCALSPALASVVGRDSMPRQQVVKRLWDIAKEREMFDPKNKQFVICDAEFERLFGKKRLRMFALMKYLKNHVKNVD